MTTIASLAQELHAQPYEVSAFADLGPEIHDDTELDTETVDMIREAWAEAGTYVSTATENSREDRVLDQVAQVVDRAGYDY